MEKYDYAGKVIQKVKELCVLVPDGTAMTSEVSSIQIGLDLQLHCIEFSFNRGYNRLVCSNTSISIRNENPKGMEDRTLFVYDSFDDLLSIRVSKGSRLQFLIFLK